MSSFGIGDRVRLLKLEEWFFKGIPADDVVFLKSCVGAETEIIGFDDYGHAELDFERPAPEGEYLSHTIWVVQDWIEKV